MGQRGLNTCAIAGTVGRTVDIGQSKFGVNYVRFSLAIEDRKGSVTWVRCTGYGGLHDVCRGRLSVGDFVVVRGELVSVGAPPNEHKSLEVRAEEIIFSPKGGGVPRESVHEHDESSGPGNIV